MGCGRWTGGCLLLLGGVLAGLPSRNPEGVTAPAENQTSGAPGSGPLTLETPGDVFEYVATPLDWWQADGYCKGRFARLPPATWERELEALGRRLQPHHPRGAIWLEDKEVRLQRPSQRRARPVPILVFRNKTDTKFVKVLADFPAMAAVSACAHVQWDPRAVEVSTVFSYAVPAFINEFQLRGFVDEEGLVRLAIILHGHHSPYLPAFRSDGQWHHLCVTWQQRHGSWALYADGREKASATGLLASQPIAGHGTFIIGQDQDALGGAFAEKEAFSGNLTGLQVWQRALSQGQVARVRSCSAVEEGLVLGWSRDVLQAEGSVQQAVVQLTCPGPTEECRVLALASGALSLAPCLQALPFACHYKRDVYFRLKEVWPRSIPPLAARVNARAHAAVIPESVFQADAQSLNLSAAAAFLGVVEGVLSDAEPPPLDAAALLGVFHLLSRASEAGVQEPGEPLAALEQLGQHYVEVAGRLLEPGSADQWAEIQPIVGGPMAIVEGVQKVAASLQQLLSPERPQVTLQSKNVGVQVWQVQLGRTAASSAVYVPPSGQQEQLDQIEVPAEDLERLRARGLRRLTLTNTWFGCGSLQRLLAGGHTVVEGAAVAVSDGGRRHLRTRVGSAIISSTLTGDFEEISTAVRFRLRHHRPQGLPDQRVEPVCAFWDFRRSPEAGGEWSAVGCSVASSHADFTSCSCNHTTNFAVLLQVYEVQRSAEEESTLKTLTFVGCGVSFCALSVTFVLFLAVGVPKSERTTVHKNLIFALAAAEALLMFSELATSSQGACLAVTALLHLFFMAAFAWMLVEGLLLWSKVVAVNLSEDRRMRFYYATGWGPASGGDRWRDPGHLFRPVRGRRSLLAERAQRCHLGLCRARPPGAGGELRGARAGGGGDRLQCPAAVADADAPQQPGEAGRPPAVGHHQACAGAAASPGAHLGVWRPGAPQHRLGVRLHPAELTPGPLHLPGLRRLQQRGAERHPADEGEEGGPLVHELLPPRPLSVQPAEHVLGEGQVQPRAHGLRCPGEGGGLQEQRELQRQRSSGARVGHGAREHGCAADGLQVCRFLSGAVPGAPSLHAAQHPKTCPRRKRARRQQRAGLAPPSSPHHADRVCCRCSGHLGFQSAHVEEPDPPAPHPPLGPWTWKMEVAPACSRHSRAGLPPWRRSPR